MSKAHDSTSRKPDESPASLSGRFRQVGWWVPGSLESGWDANIQANFNDMADKFRELCLTPLVSSLPLQPNLGFYYSEAEFDFIQLLTAEKRPGYQLPALPMVTYSVWLASQGWGHFSPLPLMHLQGVADDLSAVQSPPAVPNSVYPYPCGWYLPGTFSGTWYQDLPGNYELARQKRRELGLHDLSPLYFTQSTFYDCVQMVQVPLAETGPDAGPIADYVAWFAEQSFGRLSYVPFLSPAFVNEAVQKAGKTP